MRWPSSTEVAALPYFTAISLFLHDNWPRWRLHGFHLHKFLFFKETIGFRNARNQRLKRGRYRFATQRRGRVLDARSEQICHVLRTKSSSTSPSSADTVLLTQDLAVTAMEELARR